MSSAPSGSGDRSVYQDDEKLLHRLGYAQQLFRAMGGFQNFAISFTIISILAGCLTSYWVAFERGGPVAITWGWLLVGVDEHDHRPGDGGDRVRRSRPPAACTTGRRSSAAPAGAGPPAGST